MCQGQPSPFLTFLNGYMATSSLWAASCQGISCCQLISSNTNWMGSPEGSLLSRTLPFSSWITLGTEGPVDSSSICRGTGALEPSPAAPGLQDSVQIQQNTVQLLVKTQPHLPPPGAALNQRHSREEFHFPQCSRDWKCRPHAPTLPGEAAECGTPDPFNHHHLQG